MNSEMFRNIGNATKTSDYLIFVISGTAILVPLVIRLLREVSKDGDSNEITKTQERQNYERNCRPFRNFLHPEKPILDKILSFVFPYLIPVADLAKVPSHNKKSEQNLETKKTLISLRNKISKLSEAPRKTSCQQWNALIQKQKSDDVLISGTVTIPRNNEVLSMIGLLNSNPSPALSSVLSSHPPEENGPEVTMDLTCPSSAVISGIDFDFKPGSDDDVQQLKDYGCRRFKTCRLQNIVLRESSQLLLWFHGGGLALGSREESYGLDTVKSLFDKLMTQQQRVGGRGTIVIPPLVTLSVEYRLAPENPFPAAVIDGLSASTFLINNYPSLQCHVGGVSGGGNLAAVVGLESHRACPGKVRSIFADVPMTRPAAQSRSYHLNSKSSGVLPVEAMRWFWSAYLQLDETADGSVDFYASGGIAEALERSTVWSYLYNGGDRPKTAEAAAVWRLVCPQADVSGLDNDHFPNVYIVTSTADPLHDDGVELVEKLRDECKDASDKISHFDLKGSHALSPSVDAKGRNLFVNEWSKSFE